jgi:uncharacterized small protein (DUF1192 family)
MIFEENDAPLKKPALKVLDALSIVELTDYIAQLETEIARVKAAIDAKQAHAQAAAGFFKS